MLYDTISFGINSNSYKFSFLLCCSPNKYFDLSLFKVLIHNCFFRVISVHISMKISTGECELPMNESEKLIWQIAGVPHMSKILPELEFRLLQQWIQ
jgi:hypothetical protein